MKQLICLFVLGGLTLTQVIAQVHLKGQRFYDIQAGLTDGFHLADNKWGMNVIVSTGAYKRKYNAWKTTLSVIQKPLPVIGSESLSFVRQFGVGYGYEFNLWRNPMRPRFIRGIVQPILLYESAGVAETIPDSTKLYQGTSHLLLGGDVGFEIELSPMEISIRLDGNLSRPSSRFIRYFLLGGDSTGKLYRNDHPLKKPRQLSLNAAF